MTEEALVKELKEMSPRNFPLFLTRSQKKALKRYKKKLEELGSTELLTSYARCPLCDELLLPEENLQALAKMSNNASEWIVMLNDWIKGNLQNHVSRHRVQGLLGI